MTTRRRTQRRKPSARPRSWEKKFENMRGRESIGFELSTGSLFLVWWAFLEFSPGFLFVYLYIN